MAGDAEARGHIEARAVGGDERALGEGRPHALRDLGRSGRVGPRQDQAELLAAPARGEIDLASRRAEHVGELAQGEVADRVAEPVVHALEVVEVGDHEGERRTEAERARQLAGERLLGGAAVGQPGEPVDERLALEDPVQTCVLERGDAMADEQRDRLDVLDRELGPEEDDRPSWRRRPGAGAERDRGRR